MTKPIHPFAAKLPPMSSNEFETLIESIASEGQLFPVILDQKGRVIDGIHRILACERLEIQPRFETRSFADEVECAQFIWDTNLARRHISAGRRAALCLILYNDLQELRSAARSRQAKAGRGDRVINPSKTREIVARRAKASTATAAKAMAIADRDPELLAKVAKPGGPSLDAAYKQVRRVAEQEGTAGKLAVDEAEAAEHRSTPSWAIQALWSSPVFRSSVEGNRLALDPFAGNGEIPNALFDVAPDLRWSLVEMRASCETALQALPGCPRVTIEDFFELGPERFCGIDVAIFNPPFSRSKDAVHRLFDCAHDADIWMLQRRNWIDQARVPWLRKYVPDEFVLPRRIRFGQAASGKAYQGTDNCLHCWYHWPRRRRGRRVGKLSFLTTEVT